MKIERVDERTVKCFLSNEELEEYDIDYKDFILRSEKAREVVQEIIEQAEEQVGYKPPKFAFDLQIMMLPDQGLLLTFSEKDAEFRDGEQLIECLKEMKQILERTKERIGMAGAESGGSAVMEQPRRQPVQKPDFAVFAFSVLTNVMSYAAAIPSNLRMDSELYEMDGNYFLFLRKGGASYERFSRACVQAMEFGSLYTADEDKTTPIKEHGTCLIETKALRKLRG
ncbi:MAG: adaptor protein MecA [Eubacterium sp.]|nr:adaptor protein MecA [Eubacterium sp.]MCM1213896.1 adaptor protein MecA [Lachnospiraceae bacterium]MCM1304065.1 adaptor protein MecA [Butyrivibrio sp.]MCM1343577.1 adaptor protein MecA [Muribaculaceae bacterium]MCM1240156.1 adaptor protein MecA [Lachnospiraceae bacterium]